MPKGQISGQSNNAQSLLRLFRSSLPSDGSMFYEHHHTALEITMVLSGSGIYATDESEFSFESGDIFLFGTDERHWIKKLDRRTDFLNVHFEPRFIWSENFGISSGELIRVFLNRKKNPLNKLDMTKESSMSVKRLIFQMEKELEEKKREHEIMLKVHLVNILIEMIRSFEGQIDENDFSYNAQALHHIERSLKYIDSHLSENITLEEIANVAHMSKNYFCRIFKKLNGMSPWDYITVKRIEHAVMLLNTTDLTRLEIAQRCGYNNTSNFYYAFKKVTGKAPGDYIKMF
ncbi:MAG: AraC family transcriptional regulator [Clostridia bacterium]|nr:AraC family transcriptional regulator [Clostridia bacterium]